MTNSDRTNASELNLPLYELAFQTTPVGLSYVTMDRRVVLCNPALCAFLGRSLDEIKSIGISELTHPDDLDLHDHLHQRLLAGDIDRYALDKRYLHKDGRSLWAHLEVVVVRDDTGVRRMMLSQIVDIGERVAQSEKLRWLASHDQLTSLANRQMLFERLEKSLASASASNQVAVLYIDIDGFKAVNDRYGHLAGDRRLQNIAACLLAALRAQDMAARIGGDEFVIVLDGIGDQEHPTLLARQLLGSFAAFKTSDSDDTGDAGNMSASIGIAIGHDESAEALLQRADAAMYAAKRNGDGQYAWTT